MSFTNHVNEDNCLKSVPASLTKSALRVSGLALLKRFYKLNQSCGQYFKFRECEKTPRNATMHLLKPRILKSLSNILDLVDYNVFVCH